jgi:hypothetical protein
VDSEDREEGSPETGRDSQAATVPWGYLFREMLPKDMEPPTISKAATVRWGHLFRETGEQRSPWAGTHSGKIHLRHRNSKGQFVSCP